MFPYYSSYKFKHFLTKCTVRKMYNIEYLGTKDQKNRENQIK